MKKIFLWSLAVLASVIIYIVFILFLYISSGNVISTGQKISGYDSSHSALFVIDIQEASTGYLATSESIKTQSKQLIENVNTVIDSSVTKDVKVIYIVNEVENWLLNILFPELRKGAEGTKLDKRLRVVSNNIFAKNKKDAFDNLKLDEFLVNNKIGTIYITGLDAAHCINNTIYAALNRNYKVFLLNDCVISESEESKNEALDNFIMAGVNIISASLFLTL